MKRSSLRKEHIYTREFNRIDSWNQPYKTFWRHELFPNVTIPNVKIPNVKIPNVTIPKSHNNPECKHPERKNPELPVPPSAAKLGEGRKAFLPSQA